MAADSPRNEEDPTHTQGVPLYVLQAGQLPTFDTASGSVMSVSAHQLQLQEMTRLLLDQAGDGIYGLDQNGFVTFVNRAAQRMAGWSIADMRGHTQHSLVHHSHPDGSIYPREDCPIYKALHGDQSHFRDNEVFWRKDGSCFPVAYTSTPLVVNGENYGAVVVFRDITFQVQTREWEKRKTEIFASIVALEPLTRTLQLIAESLNRVQPAFSIAILIREDTALHLRGESNLPTDLRAVIMTVPLVAKTQLCGRVVLQRTAMLADRTFTVSAEGGAQVDMKEWSLPLLTTDGQTLGALSIFGQITPSDQERCGSVANEAAELARLAIEHSKLQSQLTHQARHDALTGLPNRNLLEDRLEQAIVSARRQGSQIAVCYFDLDRFKQINDSLGHSVGDKYLQTVTRKLLTKCREVDTLARQGGDEFILVLQFLTGPEEAVRTAQQMLHELGTPFTVDDLQFSASASIGISLYPQHGTTSEVLLQHADTALYAAKHAGRNQVRLFDFTLAQQAKESSQLQAGLHHALGHGHLRLAYQPIYGIHGDLQGFEVLVRWHDPVKGNIPPARFIPVAEESGLIVPIGAWVLNQACRQNMEWQHEGLPPTRIFVNVSGVQLDREDFRDTVAAALHRSGLHPTLLGLEITETSMVADPKAAAARLHELRQLGITISVDDFGTGQSSFAFLHALPLDTLKIDRSFIATLADNPRHLSTVQAIVTLAHQLGLRTVAEGVETPQQLEQLRSTSCDAIQGFYYAKPLSSEDAGWLLSRESAQTFGEPLTLLAQNAGARPRQPALK